MNKPLARIGQRFTAQFVDGLAAIGCGVISYFIAHAIGLADGWIFLGWVVYILLCDGLPGGQSLGKRFTHTSVVQAKSELPCTYWQSCVRNITMVLGVLLMLPLSLASRGVAWAIFWLVPKLFNCRDREYV
ncbi:RDD family protein [Rhodoferax saidenbachensis]|uniref:RDD family membrane protein YckC n=1 Tax=Rhodoferax saidenbachensis TaxID=1484693 RepID=A0ABU1ZT65_9BURK|nr:RDD family protein [Rhodoferax saidenbachensis]MDR7308751.1 putative RDD family membrane protein YckC [Rhodoferax saidenbachensis]